MSGTIVRAKLLGILSYERNANFRISITVTFNETAQSTTYDTIGLCLKIANMSQMSWEVLIIWLQTRRWYHPPCQILSTQCSGWVSWLIFNEFSSNSTSPDISHRPSSSHGGDFQQFLKNLICLLCSTSSLPLCEKLTKDLHIRNKMQPRNLELHKSLEILCK